MRLWRYFEVKFAVVLFGGLAVAWTISALIDQLLPGAGRYVFWLLLIYPFVYLAGLTVGAYRARSKGRPN